MQRSIEDNMVKILSFLANIPRSEVSSNYLKGSELQEGAELTPEEINDAAEILQENNYVELTRTMGTAPFDFAYIELLPKGRLVYEQMQKKSDIPERIARPPIPVGSPYGFQDQDWEEVLEAKSTLDKLRVVFGHPFESINFETSLLQDKVKTMFQTAVQSYNSMPNAIQVTLEFKPLAAGYGEHLFNEIARNIISADIAVFETSDLNPNVMLEMGVALTWGVRVLPIKKEGCPKPPSDISGQTYADYRDSGRSFVDSEHDNKMFRMVELAARKKGRA